MFLWIDHLAGVLNHLFFMFLSNIIFQLFPQKISGFLPPILVNLWQGSLNVPIFHITQTLGMNGLLDGYYFWWCPLYSQVMGQWHQPLEDLKDLLLHREVGLLSRLSVELCSEAIGARGSALEAATQLAVELLPLPGCAEWRRSDGFFGTEKKKEQKKNNKKRENRML